MVKVFSPLDRDHTFTRNNEEYVLRANAETELPLAAAAHAVRTLGHLGVMQLRHPNDVAKAERKLNDTLRVQAGRARNLQGTASASPEIAAEVERHERRLNKLAARKPAAIELPPNPVDEPETPKAKKAKKAKKEAQPAPKE